MSINDLVDDLDALAVRAAVEAKAVEPCRFHKDVLIYRGDRDADSRAYALATNAWKADGQVFDRSEVMDAVKDVFDQAADGTCPTCGGYRNA